VSIPIPGRDDALLGQIDTGFNGYLFVHQTIAEQLGFISSGQTTELEFADHTQHSAHFAAGRIEWFGKLLDIDVLVTARSLPRMMPDDPIGLIGTALLNPHKLIIDFTTRRVLITQAD
jgi:predicted aspartyl protease